MYPVHYLIICTYCDVIEHVPEKINEVFTQWNPLVVNDYFTPKCGEVTINYLSVLICD